MSRILPHRISTEFAKARFLSDSSATIELLLLVVIEENMPLVLDQLQTLSLLSRPQITAALKKLEADGDIKIEKLGDETYYRVTERGTARSRYMFVDYFHELRKMESCLTESLVARLSKLAQEGIRSVAVYPVGETAEVVAAALPAAGMSLAMAVDDSPSAWDRKFHGLSVRPTADLKGARIDGVILATCVFQEQLRKQLATLGIDVVIIPF